MFKTTLVSLAIATTMLLPLTASAVDSSKVERTQFAAKANQSYVKYEKEDCTVLTKQGRTIEGHTFGGSSSEIYDTVCPKDKPVMVSVSRQYAIQSGLLSAITGMSQGSVVTCCPMGHHWVDVKKDQAGNPEESGQQA